MASLKKNLVINISYQLFVVLMPLIVAPYVTRTIGPDGAGVYSYTYSIASCFALIGMLGIANYGNRSIASCDGSIESRSIIFWNVWSIQIICTLIACIIYIFYCFVFPINNKTIAIIQIITVLCSAFDISWFFYGIEKFNVTVFRNFIIKILNLLLIFIFVKNEGDLLKYVLIMVIGVLLNNLLLFLFLKKEIVYKKPDIKKIKSHIKPIIVLFFPVVAISIYKLMDKVMIGLLADTTETGFYEYAEKIIGLPGTIITAIGAVMLPRLSSIIGKNDRKRAASLLQITIEAMMVLTIGMAAGIICVGQDFAPLFFGEKFEKSGLIMMTLAPSVVFQGWANVIRTEYLIPEKKDAVYVKSAWLGAVVNLTMNFIFIPHFQAVGAAIGTVCAEGAVAIYQSVCARHDLSITGYVKKTMYYFVPAFVMWIAVQLVKNLIQELSVMKICLEILTALVIYIAISLPYVYYRFKSLKSEGAL